MHRLAALILTASFVTRSAVATPKEDVESLMEAFMPLAQNMLEKHSEFYPFGAALTPERKIVLHGGYTGTEHPKSADLIKLLTESFRSDAAQGKCIATALVTDIRTIPPGHTQKTDAICASLEHRDDYAVDVVFPYTRNEKGIVTLQQASARSSANDEV